MLFFLRYLRALENLLLLWEDRNSSKRFYPLHWLKIVQFLASPGSINKDVFSDCALLGEFFGCWVVQYMCGGLGVLGCGL